MTIRHIVAWRIAETDPELRAQHAAEVASQLRSLVGQVPSIRELSAGPGVVDGNWDVAIVADFDDIEGLQAYQVHPYHQKVAEYVRSVVSERATVDFEL